MTCISKPVAVAALFIAAAVGNANAAVIISESKPANLVTVGNGTYQEIDFKFTGVTPPDDQPGLPPNNYPAGILILDGTFNAVGQGAMMAVPGDNAPNSPGYFRNFITKGAGGRGSLVNNDTGDSFNYAASYVAISSLAPGTGSRTGTGTSAEDSTGAADTIMGTSPSFSGTWYTSEPLTPGTTASSILAKVFVTPGDDVNFTGDVTTYGSNSEPLTFGASVPEPATAGLLACSLGGLLIRRRRQA